MKKYLISILVIVIVAMLSIAGTRLLQSPGVSKVNTPNSSTVLNDPGDPVSHKIPASEPNENPPAPANDSLPVYQPPGENQPSVPDPDPALQDRTVYSWWFKRNQEHQPPRFSPELATMADGKGLYLGDPAQKTVYLTFDEGYENGFTPQILDVLKANGTPAAFFVTSDFMDKNPDLVKRMVAEGHEVGNHTATHPSLPGRTNAEIRAELNDVQKKVLDLTGVSMTYMRPPRGEFNRRVLDVAASQGYQTVFWSMAYRDWETDRQPGRDAALKHVTDNLHPGAVILLHAVSRSNAEALDDIIKGIRKQGYSFGELSQLHS